MKRDRRLGGDGGVRACARGPAARRGRFASGDTDIDVDAVPGADDGAQRPALAAARHGLSPLIAQQVRERNARGAA
ncbi:hypothetical protein [Solimonas flava]|uniref:hypothetical protein n=1 Tax=Solimonas flava TaxID=415849 RepID=UPI000412DD3D|nr:hypothetical protein [Solimonas flava]